MGEFDPWVGKLPWRRKWQPTPVFWPGKSHGQRILAGYNLWNHEESDMTEHTRTQRRWLRIIVDMSNVTELFPLKWFIFCYVNFISAFFFVCLQKQQHKTEMNTKTVLLDLYLVKANSLTGNKRTK